MKIALTNHSKERLAERVGVKPEKMQKLAEKAWISNEQPTKRTKFSEYTANNYYQDGSDRIIKVLMGKNYIFTRKTKKLVLLLSVT